MIDSLSMPDIIEFLPTGLQDLIFSEDLETTKENLAKMFGLSYEDEMLLHNALTKYLIGQFDINIFKTRLLEILKNEKNLLIALEYLNKKFLDKFAQEIKEAQNIYKTTLDKINHPKADQLSKENLPSQDIMNYIKSRAEKIQKVSLPEETVLPKTKEIKNIPKETVSSEIKDLADLPVTKTETTKPVHIKEKTLEKPILEKKESLTEYPLASLIKQQQKKEVKLSEYYKNLKNTMSDNLNPNNSETNIFQPPFKTKKGGAMIESSFGEGFGNEPLDIKTTDVKNDPDSSLKDPIKYNSVKINPDFKSNNQKIGSDITTDDDFIDLGDKF